VVERCEQFLDTRINRLVREPSIGGELGVDYDVAVVGVVREEAALRVREDLRFSQ